MRCSFQPSDRDLMAEDMGVVWMGYWAVLEGGLGCNTHEAFPVTRLTVGVSNGLQMTRNLIGGLPVVYQGHLANLGPFRECLTPAHEKRRKGTPGA